jgi:hypothetical protein
VRSQGDDVIGADDALIAQTEATREIEAAGQGAKIASGFGGAMREALIVVGAEMSEQGVVIGPGISEPGGMLVFGRI